ncbi:hypothetical protein PRIPAC_96204 [Pristionchus pacificus]|uniref:Uncharacterized protein n=1 Tax=Pristionchus pacificus TaxID=54126 RepID=A0A2A6BDJ3_PRIPA|nr:hypothetical protein PRIPAC_96204 [Pristionchus pacificus]|eukprot:PDM63965.1 hypothetical protein PRIPAC_49466 [Pristionchus pacificus]
MRYGSLLLKRAASLYLCSLNCFADQIRVDVFLSNANPMRSRRNERTRPTCCCNGRHPIRRCSSQSQEMAKPKRIIDIPEILTMYKSSFPYIK